jgi:hypothetical protein
MSHLIHYSNCLSCWVAKNNCTYLEVCENWTQLCTISCISPVQHAKQLKPCSPLWNVTFHPHRNFRVIWRRLIPARVVSKKKKFIGDQFTEKTISDGGPISWLLPSLMDILWRGFVEGEVYQSRHQEMWSTQTALLKHLQTSHQTQECGRILRESWGASTEDNETEWERWRNRRRK